MVSKFKSVALAGVLAFVAAPAFAQGKGVPVVGDLPIITDLPVVGNTGADLDLDPLHIFAPAAAPAAPAAVVVHHHHHHHVVHHVVHHHHHLIAHKKKK